MRRPISVTALACLLLVLAAPAAGAHALLRGSDPAGGASLDKAPEQVTLTFTEPPDLSLSSVHVLDSGGRAVERGRAQGVAGKPLQLEVPVGQLGDGTYTVTYRVVSRLDGHLTAGAFAFGVGVSAPAGTSGGGQAAVPTTPPASPLSVAGRWALDWGLILLVGAAAIGLLVFQGRAERIAGLSRPLLLGSVALAAVGLVISIAAERSRVCVSLGDLLASSTGGKLIGQAAVLGGTGVVLAAVLRWPRRWELLALLGVGAAATMLVHVASGHAAQPSSLGPLNLIAQWVHLLAVGVWVGGFLWLLLAIRGGGQEGERVAAVQRFSVMATVALGLVVLTGLARALEELGGWHGLVSTSFGRTLLVKGALVAVLMGLGGTNRFWVVPALRAGRAKLQTVGATVRGELAVAVPILVAAALLSELPPAKFVTQAEQSRQNSQPAVVVNGNDFATTTRVELRVTPGGTGPNRFAAKVVDYDTRQPAPADRVSLSFALPARPDVGGSSLDLTRAGDGTWQGQGSQLSIAGRWNVTVLVARPGGAVTVPLQLQTRSAEPSQQVRVSRVPGQPAIYTITLAQGGTLQAYLDPGRPGRNVLHLTYFDPRGAELPISGAHASATTPAGTRTPLTLQLLSAGHFAANLDLSAGRWSFAVDATTKAGASTSAKFEQVIEQ